MSPKSGGIDPDVCRMAYKVASRVAKEMESYSLVINRDREEAIARFDREEIMLGDLLGAGGFNNVFELYHVDLIDQIHQGEMSEKQRFSRENFAIESNRDKFAIKMLQTSVMEDKEDYSNGAADLMVETKILSNLPVHPNIIQIHGMAAAGADGFSQGVEGGYFIIIDRLKDTLDQRISVWEMQGTSLMDRLMVALHLSSALKHLHQHNIVFRDLKPENVGFDMHGTLKLFDFGLAKELNPNEKNTDGTFEMSGQTGSRRYMAPEVALNESYNLGADVYSFAILLWQICSMSEPFEDMTMRMHLERVCKGNERPPLDPEWPSKLSNILKWSWTSDKIIRPPMKEIHRAIKRQVRSLAEPQMESLAGSLSYGASDINSVGEEQQAGGSMRSSFKEIRNSFKLGSSPTSRNAFSISEESNNDQKSRSRLSDVLGEALALDR